MQYKRIRYYQIEFCEEFLNNFQIHVMNLIL